MRAWTSAGGAESLPKAHAVEFAREVERLVYESLQRRMSKSTPMRHSMPVLGLCKRQIASIKDAVDAAREARGVGAARRTYQRLDFERRDKGEQE